MLVAELPAAVSALPLFGGGRTPLALVKTPASHLLAVAPSMSLAVLKYRDQKHVIGSYSSSQFQVPAHHCGNGQAGTWNQDVIF